MRAAVLTVLGLLSLTAFAAALPAADHAAWSTRVPPGTAVFEGSASATTTAPLAFGTDAAIPVFGGETRMPGVRVGEPGVKAAPDGTFYVFAPGYLAVGRIHGTNWQSIDLRSGLGPVVCGCDSDLALDDQGFPQYADLAYQGSNGGAISVGFTPDKGKDWVSNPQASLRDKGMDRQWIETNGLTTTYLTYRTGGNIFLAVSPVGPTPVFLKSVHTNSAGSNFRAGYLAVDKANNIAYLFYTSGNQVRVDRVMDFGETITDLHVADTGDNNDAFAAGAVDDAGNVYVVWNSKDMTPAGLVTNSYYAWSTNQGDSFSAPIKLNQAPVTTVFPWAVAGKDGTVGIVYYGSSVVAEPGYAKGDWFVYYNYITNAHSAAPTMSENLAVPHKVKTGEICTYGTGCYGAGLDRSFLDYFGVSKTKDGRAIIAFNDQETTPYGQAPYIHFIQQTDGPRLE